MRPKDSISAIAKLTVKPQDPKETLPAGFEATFAEEFRARFTPPARVSLSAMVGADNCDSKKPQCPAGELWLSSTALVVAETDGSFSRIGLADESVTPAIAELQRAALEKMSTERAIPRSGRRSLSLMLTIRMDANQDTVARERKLFLMRVPRYDLPFTNASSAKGGPKYPSNAERGGIGDTVAVSFVVRPDGSVDPGSVAIVSGRYRDFIASVLDWVGRSRYQPASLGACPVASWTKQTFIFQTTR
ncbi:MAG TPA: energy transducer TonB [Gemmatimonadaceae bacterium]|nr:energy transducer TonB [Gemmatimonadaceae bacterium]